MGEPSRESLKAWEDELARVRRVAPDYVANWEKTQSFEEARRMFLLGFVKGQVAAYREVNSRQVQERSDGHPGPATPSPIDDAREGVSRLLGRLRASGEAAIRAAREDR